MKLKSSDALNTKLPFNIGIYRFQLPNPILKLRLVFQRYPDTVEFFNLLLENVALRLQIFRLRLVKIALIFERFKQQSGSPALRSRSGRAKP